MSEHITFNSILKNPDNWPEDGMDLDAMTNNFIKLKRIMPIMFLREPAKNPEILVVLFSQENFADNLINFVSKAFDEKVIKEVEAIWICEYGEDDKKELVQKGYLSHYTLIPGVVPVVYTFNNDNVFINVFV